MKTFKMFAAVLVAAIGLVGLANADPQRHTSAKFGFSVVMPGDVNTAEQPLKTPVGEGKQIVMTYADTERMVLATAIELPPLFDNFKNDPTVLDSMYDGFTKGFAQTINGSVSRSKFSENGLTGEEFTVTGSGVKFVGRIFLASGKVYALVTTAPAEANDYYKSFQLVAK